MREATSSATLLQADNQAQSEVCHLSALVEALLQPREQGQSPLQLYAHPQPDAPPTVK